MASKLTSSQKHMCFEVISELQKYSICYIFNQPVDPEKDSCPDYFDVISNPMDLGTVKQKLSNNKYSSIKEWKRDMSLIWDNSISYNPAGTIVNDCAQHLKNVYERLSKKITDDPDFDWLKEFESIDNQIHKIRKGFKRHYNIPDDLKDYKPPARPAQSSTQRESKEYAETKPPKPAVKKDSSYSEKPPKQEKRREKEQSKQRSSSHAPPPPPPPKVAPPPPPPQEKKPAPKAPEPISKEKLREIYEKFSEAANDDDTYNEAVEIINRGEGFNDDDEIEINIDQLSEPTLRELANFFGVKL